MSDITATLILIAAAVFGFFAVRRGIRELREARRQDILEVARRDVVEQLADGGCDDCGGPLNGGGDYGCCFALLCPTCGAAHYYKHWKEARQQ